MSNYGLQLREKQKLRRIYGILERQFRRTFAEAARRKGSTGETCSSCSNRVLTTSSTAWASAPRAPARQLVSHKAILVDGKMCTSPGHHCAECGDQRLRQVEGASPHHRCCCAPERIGFPAGT